MYLFHLKHGLFRVKSGVLPKNFGHKSLLSLSAQLDNVLKSWKKIIARTLCFMHQSVFRPIYIFNSNTYFLDFRAQNIPLIFFNLNPFYHQQTLHFGVLNYEKQHKEGTCTVWGRSVVFSAFYADFCFRS